MALERNRLAAAASDRAPPRRRWRAPTSIADDVDLVVGRLAATGVRWLRSLNEGGAEAMGCKQAARVRERLGSGENGGIPLWAELKSIVGCIRSRQSGESVGYWAVHTRANTTVDLARLAVVLRCDPKHTSVELLFEEDDDTEERGGTAKAMRPEEAHWFGRVNPFLVDRALRDIATTNVRIDDVLQIVDTSLWLPGGVPDTVLTNIGTRTEAVEMRARHVLRAICSVSPRSRKARVAVPDPIWQGIAGTHARDYWLSLAPPTGPKIGILTGNGPDSGRTLWADVLDAMRKRDPLTRRSVFAYLPDVLAPAVVINSLPAMGLSMDLVERNQEVRKVVRLGVQELLDAGCGLVALACNTTIYYTPMIERMCAERGAEFVSIAEASVGAIRRAHKRVGGGAVGLAGIAPVVDLTGGYSGYRRPLAWLGDDVKGFPADDLAFRVKSLGVEKRLVTPFSRAMDDIPSDVRVVVLALTELSMLYRDYAQRGSANRHGGDDLPKREYVDPLRELARMVAYRYLVRGYKGAAVCQLAGVDVESKLAESFGWREPPTLGAKRSGSVELGTSPATGKRLATARPKDHVRRG
jgi:aspartate racemase